MHFSYEKVYTVDELKGLVEVGNINFDPQFVAVEGLVFDEGNKWILMRRGPGCRDEQYKLEGIGGRVDDESDLVAALARELREEAGEDALISVVEPFEIRTDTVFDSRLNRTITWVIASFICVHKSGDMKICEPTKNLGFEKLTLSEISIDELSSSAKSAYAELLENWESVKEIISKGFNHD
ncbi:MAG: Nucleoside triphosphatase NudI [Dehalococcoidia bacterium]|nr:Nucleoside triphosphatase NudI [Bacillota bacterium]